MNTQQNNSNTVFRAATLGEKLVNPNVNQYRLTNDQRFFYTQLFNENASPDGKVKRKNFLPLLGILGTKIAQDFADRMFLVLSKGNQEITLEQYLNYIDTYHYGDVHERCLYTCKLIDTKQKGKIELKDFQSYIYLIFNTVKKINNPLTKKDLMSDKDIEYLFYHISKGKPYFTYSDFENIYQEKPELVSWFDYFKNDKEDILLIINEFIPTILKIFNEFVYNFINDLFVLLDKEKEINIDLLSQQVLKYSNKLDRIMSRFIKKVSKFNIVNAFHNLTKQDYNRRNLVFDLKNVDKNNQDINEIKNDNNINEIFDEIKKSLYQKDEKEFILENGKIKYPLYRNETKCLNEKFLKRSNMFRNKNFKFFQDFNGLRNSNDNFMKKNSFLSDMRETKTIINKSTDDIELNSKFNDNETDINKDINNLNKSQNIIINHDINNLKKNRNNNIKNDINNININQNNNFSKNINKNLNNNINNNINKNLHNNINNNINKTLNNNINNDINKNLNNNINNNLNINQYYIITNNIPAIFPFENLNQNYIQPNIINYNNNYYYDPNNNNIYYYDTNNIYYTNNTLGIDNNYGQYTYGMISDPNTNFDSNILPVTNYYKLEESEKLKQLLFCSRIVIEKTLEATNAFNSCYKWIRENYLSKYISKKIKEEKLKEKKKFKKKNTMINIPRKIVPVKKKIIGASEKSFEILFNMIMGIQIAVQAVPNFRIKNREEIQKYLTKMLYSVQSVYLGKGQEESYLLKEFGGVIFNNLRFYLGINKEDFIKSISPQDFITELMISSQTLFEELCSTGSSGSLLYYTRDGEFIVKTISRKEYKFLKKMLGEYFFYLKENPLSFLPKLLGCYVLKRKYKKNITNIYFIVMSNVFATDNHIDLRFDLKGSTIGRSVLKGTKDDSIIFAKGDLALKDLDFNKNDERVYIGAKRQIILDQIKKDIEFLYSINSNDYSLLLGIHYIQNLENYNFSTATTYKATENKNESFISHYSRNDLFSQKTYETESNISSEQSVIERINRLKSIYDFEDGGILSDDKKRIYYFGIIDILTEFNTKKRFEYCFKRMRYCSDNMSCVPPIYYKERFYNYLQSVFPERNQNNREARQNIITNTINNFTIKGMNVDKYGAISSSKYKQYQKEEIEREKFTMEDSLQKF